VADKSALVRDPPTFHNMMRDARCRPTASVNRELNFEIFLILSNVA